MGVLCINSLQRKLKKTIKYNHAYRNVMCEYEFSVRSEFVCNCQVKRRVVKMNIFLDCICD